jgi:transposase
MAAATRFEHGQSPSQIARWLRVGERQVRKWRQAWLGGGVDALRSSGPQSAPLVSDEQFARLENELRKGPSAHGWDEDQRWTLARIVTVTERLFGIRYTQAGMSLLLRRHGWTVQVPVRRAIERDDAAVETWIKETWPQVKGRRRPSTPGSSSRTRRVRA